MEEAQNEVLVICFYNQVNSSEKTVLQNMKYNLECYTAKYKKVRNQVRDTIRSNYSNYLDSITSDLYRNQKPFWNFIIKSKSCRNPIPALKNGSNLVSSDSTKASFYKINEDTSNLCDLQSHLPRIILKYQNQKN